jgi:hypothetical protein
VEDVAAAGVAADLEAEARVRSGGSTGCLDGALFLVVEFEAFAGAFAVTAFLAMRRNKMLRMNEG